MTLPRTGGPHLQRCRRPSAVWAGRRVLHRPSRPKLFFQPRAKQSTDQALGARPLRGGRAGPRPGSALGLPALLCSLSLGKAGVRLERVFTSCRVRAWEEAAGPPWDGSLVPGEEFAPLAWLWAAGPEVRE